MESSPGAARPKPDVSQQLAADRTLLAWLRTAITLAGLGFVVARFHLLVAAVSSTTSWHQARVLGVALVAASLLVAALGLFQHHQVTRMLAADGDHLPVSQVTAVAAATIILLVLMALCVYLATGVR